MNTNPRSFRTIKRQREEKDIKFVFEADPDKIKPIVKEAWDLLSSKMKKYELNNAEAIILVHNMYMRVLEFASLNLNDKEIKDLKASALDTFERGIKSTGVTVRELKVIHQHQREKN